MFTDNFAAQALSNGSEMSMMSNGSPTAASPKNGKGDDQVMFKTQLCRGFMTKGRCPYEYICMFAHGHAEMRTKQMNLSDGLTSAAAVKAYQRGLKSSGYSTRKLEASVSSPTSYPSGSSAMSSMPGSPTMAPTAAFAPWMQQMSMGSVHMHGCACAECRLSQAQAQAQACPCPECIAAVSAAQAAVLAQSGLCRVVAAQAAQAQAVACPCSMCIATAHTAQVAAARPCSCPSCARPSSCNESMGTVTPGVSTMSCADSTTTTGDSVYQKMFARRTASGSDSDSK